MFYSTKTSIHTPDTKPQVTGQKFGITLDTISTSDTFCAVTVSDSASPLTPPLPCRRQSDS